MFKSAADPVLEVETETPVDCAVSGTGLSIDHVISGETAGGLGASLLLVRPDGAIIDANLTALSCYGYSREEMLDLSIRDICGPSSRNAVECQMREAVGHGAVYEEEHHRRDGTVFPVEVRAAVCVVDEETVVLASVLDISGRRKAEEELRDRERWLSESQRIAQLGHYVFDIEKDQWDGSLVLHDVLGLDNGHARDFAGWIGIAHPADREMLSRYFLEDVIGRRRPFDLEYRIVRPCDGVERWVHGLGTVEFRDDGRPHTMFGIIQDVTDRRRSEESLRVYAELLESSPASITVHTPQGEILYANERAAEVHGYSREEFLALSLDQIEVPESAESISERVRRMAEQGRDSVEVAHYRKDGSVLPLDVNSRVALWEGRAVVLSVAADATERQRVERNLLETNSLLERMVHSVTEAMGRIVELRDPYTQGHDVRVSEFAQLIAEEMGLSEGEIEGVVLSALVHDIGKLSVPAEILNKMGPLSPTEFDLIKQHPTTGYEILKGIAYTWPVAEVVLQHHERMDGSGYPQGLKGDEICGTARILAVADVVEAMASHRPYRPALGLDVAIAEIVSHPGKYDCDVVAACVSLYESGRISWE